MGVNKIRNSNVEALRLFCMFSILWIHIPREMNITAQIGINNLMRFILPLLCASVPTFCLISGYFGIRLSWRKIVKFVSLASFYSLGLYVLSLFLGRPFNITEMVKAFFTISSGGDVWFVQQYFLLMLLSPIINVLFNLPKRELTQMFALYSFIFFYFGFFRNKYGSIDKISGFDTQMLIYCYFAGHMIKLYEEKLQSFVRHPKTALVMLTSVIGGGNLLIGRHGFSWFEYNNPLIITIAAMYLMSALRINLKSNIINAIAANSFAVYVISENRWIRDYVYLWVYPYDGNFSIWLYFISIVIISIVVFLLFCSVEQLRKKVFRRIEIYVADRLTEKIKFE